MPKVHFRQFYALHLVHPADAVKCDPPQGDISLKPRQAIHLIGHPGQTGLDFRDVGFVLGRHAAANGGDEQVLEFQAIFRVVTVWLVCQACAIECREEELAAFRRAAELNPKWVVPVVNRAETLWQMGRLNESANLMRKVLDMEPNHPDRGAMERRIKKAAGFEEAAAATP